MYATPSTRVLPVEVTWEGDGTAGGSVRILFLFLEAKEIFIHLIQCTSVYGEFGLTDENRTRGRILHAA